MEGVTGRIILSTLIIATAFQGVHPVEFIDNLRETEQDVGSSVLMKCQTKSEVAQCQWMWKSLTDIITLPITVSTFEAHGEGSRDCSIRFKNVHAGQEGLWICGARETDLEPFTLGFPVKLTVRKTPSTTTPTPPPTTTPSPQPIVQFAEITHDHEVKVGMPMHLICKTVDPVDECVWTWRANGTANETNVPLHRVEPFGLDRQNCDIRFDHVLLDHDGLWTCGARLQGDRSFTTAQSIRVSVLEAVEFVQLSQDIKVAIGEPILLRCVTNIGVEDCQWSWQSFHVSNDTPSIVKRFPSYGDDGRDCSVRLTSVFEGHEGYWRCQARLASETEYTTAPPAKLTLLYPAKVKFMEQPVAIRVARGEAVVLHCVISSAMEDCSWTWQQHNKTATKPTLVKSFPPFGNYGRDCSVRFNNVLKEQEGLWGCNARGQNTTISAESVLLSVFEPVPVNFVQLSKNIHMPEGSSLLLRCVTGAVVEECRWSWQPFNDTETNGMVVKQFAPGDEGRDCGTRFPRVTEKHEGTWTCGARNHGEARYTFAPPAIVTLLQPESVTVALWATHDSNVSLACRLSTPSEKATCQWHHPPHRPMAENNHTSRFWVHHVRKTGVCTLNFTPEPRDLGQWTCSFHLDTPEGNWQLAAANLILLNTPTSGIAVSEEQLGWLVAVLALLVLVLTAILVTISICKWRNPSSEQRDTLGGSTPSGQGDKKDPSRYTDAPSKIDFQFRETMNRRLPDPVIMGLAEPSRQQHIYERVDRYITPPVAKGLYENVD